MSETHMSIQRAVLLAALAVVAVTLTGCQDVYRDTCVWHSDLKVKGCSYYWFRECVKHCHYCVTDTGPDECGQLKCAAYCAKQENEECLSNYKALCEVALKEQAAVSRCDVDCSHSAPLRSTALWRFVMFLPLLHFFSSEVAWLFTRRSVFIFVFIVIVCSLTGCGCVPPDYRFPDWQPPAVDYNKKLQRVDENGLWQGNPTWQWNFDHEAEAYECKQFFDRTSVCAVWTTKEWNCGEEDFGMCKCQRLDSASKYCESWGCHSLEADQHLCGHSGNKNEDVSCWYEPFPMNEQTYAMLVEQQATGGLTTTEKAALFRWWTYSHAHSADWGRRLRGEENSTSTADSDEQRAQLQNDTAAVRNLQAEIYFPPESAMNPVARWQYFNWKDVCIANGDNLALVRYKCHQWREIETEISFCNCIKAALDGKSCKQWTCEERDVGLFSVLFRSKDSIKPYVTGTEQEIYTCKRTGPTGNCLSWDGDIESAEEVEWSHCECADDRCTTWKCDEYELPKNQGLFHPTNLGRWWYFAGLEMFFLFVLCRGACEQEDALPVAMGCSGVVGCCLLPFLIVTFGLNGFLMLSLPFWVIRCAPLICLCCFAAKQQAEEMLEEARPKRSWSGRLKKGSSFIIGRSNSSSSKIANETSETNELS
eukprot:TRINITY_DN4755_c0_g1_i9.p1 TRINITY_DN4755_c0_g1~~TRINITY_DN4755_c0_g1_i9.p1  ORF type:complete len:649 (-),score=83.46 TRINITY_DN4755_c0_g1_i9:403-2349(-)